MPFVSVLTLMSTLLPKYCRKRLIQHRDIYAKIKLFPFKPHHMIPSGQYFLQGYCLKQSTNYKIDGVNVNNLFPEGIPEGKRWYGTVYGQWNGNFMETGEVCENRSHCDVLYDINRKIANYEYSINALKAAAIGLFIHESPRWLEVFHSTLEALDNVSCGTIWFSFSLFVVYIWRR